MEDDLDSMPTMKPGARMERAPEDEHSLDSMPTMKPGGASLAPGGALGRIDQYELVRKLGGGGFGVVYLVRDTVSGVEYALKTLHPLLKTNAEELERVRENFALVAKLLHPNIAAAHVLHRAADVEYTNEEVRRELRVMAGDPVMLMSYAPGVTLSAWRKQFAGGVVPFDRALEICRQVASALDYAHGERIVHRDIKPGNIMVETDGASGAVRARVLDFGLAAEIRSSMSRISREDGGTSGTRPYMAPEQWTGKRQDGRTDQYALACMLYELLDGRPPFAGVFETADVGIMMHAVGSEDPEPIEGLSDAQNAALLKALAKKREDRFATCGEFVAALGGEAAQVAKGDAPAPSGNDLDGAGKKIVVRKSEFSERHAEPGDAGARNGGGHRSAAVVCGLLALVGVVFAVNGYRSQAGRVEAERRAPAVQAEEARTADETSDAVRLAAEKARVEAEARAKIEEENRRRLEAAEAERKAAEEARLKAEAEARALEETRRKLEAAEAERKAAEEARQKAEAEAKALEETRRKFEAAEAERKAAEEARQKAEAKAREEARLKAADGSGARSPAVARSEKGGVQLWRNGPYWAECNVGASRPEECGYYFWWGDTVGYKRVGDSWNAVDGSTKGFSFNEKNCLTYGNDNSWLRAKGWIDASGNLVAAHDAARVHLGAPWRMPTKAEFAALKENCDTEWTTRNGVYGRLVKGRGAYASKSIFLPVASYGNGSYLYSTGSYGHYWSSTPDSDNSSGAWELSFSSINFSRSSYDRGRCNGQSVRPLR